MFKNCCDDGETMPQYFLQVCTRRVIKCLHRYVNPTMPPTPQPLAHADTWFRELHHRLGLLAGSSTFVSVPSIAKKLSCYDEDF